MNYFVLTLFSSLIPYLQAEPSPDTNVQIQNYEGPIYLHSPKPSHCPFCNNVIQSQKKDIQHERVPCESGDNYPRKAIYGHGESVITGNAAKVNPKSNAVSRSIDATLSNTDAGISIGNVQPVYADSGISSASNTCLKNTATSPMNSGTGTFGNTYASTPSYSGTGTLGNTYPISVTFGSGHNGVESGNGFCGGTQYVDNTCNTKPLPSFLPVNSAQNANHCFRIPVVTYNSQRLAEEEPLLVPQKFSYSLVLDGEVAPTLNQNLNCPIIECVLL